MSIRVGEVIAVSGVRITLKIDEDSSKETLFYAGEKFKGVSIREYIAVQRGFRDIICLIEGEYLDESRVEGEGGKVTYVRKVDARPIGYFHRNSFQQGIKYLPMIRDPAFLLEEKRIAKIFGRDCDNVFTIGRLLKEGIAIGLPWQRLFNTHMGVFGNTGSGKSNTLTKLYTVLFEQKAAAIGSKSRFVILDFNGEYTAGQMVPAESKTVFQLSTRSVPAEGEEAPGSKFPLHEHEFWNAETLSLLFQATQNTQRPFLNRVIEGRRRYEANADSLSAYAKAKFRDAFCAGECKSGTLDLMRSVARILQHAPLVEALRGITWHAGQGRFRRGQVFFDSEGVNYAIHLAPTVDALDASQLDAFDQLVLRANLRLIGDLISGYVQFEHVQPLLKRIESSLSSLRRVIRVSDNQPEDRLLTVISMRRCNSETKKVLPLLIAKHYYNAHKESVSNPPDKTVHLIIDEAHNILSQQSAREHESWKDYRLELFEELIKEGRKFGVFLTISSQRPADISPTIVSQLHNFFIHRLVNDRDLFLIDNTITTLDGLSRSLIPSLAKGCCVVTGTAFDLPMVIQVDRLEREKQPDSEDVDLETLWTIADVVPAAGS
ncbi:Type IV secretory pathway, VirB4 components [Burkholderia pseudomallei]|uniref:ATP-binding protein n=1 Tax=Burkholderia pseudomallei TaxID=28450 RepID=UPI000F080158|nr:ATP-binding protein [Burkholderia pseudomallei]VBT21682.1 Type IV secretory pathway, VirB4 components [Burkholderia pseudomallei]